MTSPMVRSILPVVLLFLVAGCAVRPVPVEPPMPIAAGEWVPLLRERGEKWLSFQAKLQFKVQTPERRTSLTALVLARLPDQLRLEVFRMGQTAGVLTLNQNQSSLYVPSEKVLYTADRSEQLIDHFFGIVLPLDTLGYSLTATLPLDQLESLQIVRSDPEYVGYLKPSPAGWSYAWHFFSDPQRIASVSARRGTAGYTMRYDPPVGLAPNSVPRMITFTSPDWRIELTVQEITPSPLLSDSVFATNFAGEIRRIDPEFKAPERP